ncbi:amidohydrolase family protein [Desulfoluna butyratoxydans]|uniref:Metal-dependent hydrolase n=1 Tax=Desulfoluna butyratoxydans TaxID=231438 RepID=A0A4U8YU24_9BACT|nr:amidohydrolase family protein [Desulfoluna butyratoxydans]VFQ44833.1 metal-dependent hydrolase [Desulfoluna butyratoxydans]
MTHIIKATLLFDGNGGASTDRYITIENDRIASISETAPRWDSEGIVTPAFIDPHSHIGMEREGEPSREGEANDEIGQILPLVDPVDSLYFDDRAFSDAVDFGVLYSCVVPGSGNLIGGKARVIRNFARYRDEAVIKDYGYKMALGYNPRSTTAWKGDRPTTRMGIYAMLEKRFDEVLLKKEKAALAKEKKLNELSDKQAKGEINETDHAFEADVIEREYLLSFDPEDSALLELLSGEKIAKVHVHKEDDILYLIKLVEKYGLSVTCDHACDVFHTEIFNKLAEREIPVVYGPIGSVGYKVELKHAVYKNTAKLMASEAFYTLMSDHPVTLSASLRDGLKFFLMHGMDEAEAISLITGKSAAVLGIDDQLGTIEEGKLASLLVWEKHPFHLGAVPSEVFAEGKKIR